MQSFLLLITMIMAATIQPASVDGDHNQPIPACSSRESAFSQNLVEDYHDRYAELASRLGSLTLDDFANHTDDVDELIADMHDLQVEWRRDGELRLPGCAFAVEVGATFGSLVDESLIAILLLDAGYNSFADWHADPITELSTEVRELLTASERSA